LVAFLLPAVLSLFAVDMVKNYHRNRDSNGKELSVRHTDDSDDSKSKLHSIEDAIDDAVVEYQHESMKDVQIYILIPRETVKPLPQACMQYRKVLLIFMIVVFSIAILSKFVVDIIHNISMTERPLDHITSLIL
jgi:Ca2+/Na+ antiporter